MSAPVGGRLALCGAPSEATLRFNQRIEDALRAAPPPGVISAAELRALRAEGKSILPIGGPLPEGRWLAYDAGAYGAPGGIGKVRVIEAERARGVYIHIHGGGWTVGGAEQADRRCLGLARTLGLTTVSLSYRLAPEHPWPSCALDVAAGARFALDFAEQAAARAGRESGSFPIFIGGESAGAHLSVVALLALRAENRISRIRAVVLNYGCFDLRMTPSTRNWGERNLVLSTPIVGWFVDNLLGADRARLAETPEVSPLLADLSGMPPAYFQVGTEDPLLDDSAFMAERWRLANAETELVLWPGGIHAYDYFDLPEHGLPIAAEC